MIEASLCQHCNTNILYMKNGLAQISLNRYKLHMNEYIDNVARFGWLLDPQPRRVEIYRPGYAVEVLENPDSLSGDKVLLGFVFNLRRVWG